MPELYAVCPRKGDILDTTREGEDSPSSKIEIYFFLTNTAVHERIAVFFFDTFLLNICPYPQILLYFQEKHICLKAGVFFRHKRAVSGILSYRVLLSGSGLSSFKISDLKEINVKNIFVRSPPFNSSFQKIL